LLKRDGMMASASVFLTVGGGGYVFKRPNGRATFTKEFPTQKAAVEALKRYARGK